MPVMRFVALAILSIGVALLSIAPLPAKAGLLLVVNSTAGTADGVPGDGACDGGGVCTLRAAIQETNATRGADVINFSIASGAQTISPGLPAITDPVTIDATTQPGFAGSPLIELNGGSGFDITGGNTTIRGFVMNRIDGGFAIDISVNGNNVIEGNFLGTDLTGTVASENSANIFVQTSNNVIGGTTTAARNVISGSNSYGVLILELGSGATGNVIQGNFIGTDATGTSALGNINGVVIAADNNIVGGMSPGASNLISGNGIGVYVGGDRAVGNVIQGNFIGTDLTGAVALGNGTGVHISGFSGPAINNITGSTSPSGRNLISGNGQFGVLLERTDGGNQIIGNYIGTDASGVHPLGNGDGIGVFADGEIIGGTGQGEANLIAFNAAYGVDVFQGIVGVTIRGNSIHSNGGEGILNNNNDSLEPPPPAIQGVGSALGTACAGCVVDVYSDNENEGAIYHGSATADASGNWSFAGAVVGPNVTATATDSAGSTSEFSAPFAVRHDAAAQKISVTQEGQPTTPIQVRVQNLSDVTATVGVYADVIPPGGTSNPYGCTPSGRVIETSVTLTPAERTTVSSADITFSCADTAGARGKKYTIVAVADVRGDDLAPCGPGELQGLACYSALADDDANPANNRTSRTCCKVK